MSPSTPIDDPIATDRLLWIQRDGAEVMVDVKIGRPYCDADDVWACPVALEGLDGPHPDIFGETSLQALALALELARLRLAQLLREGERLFYPDGREPFDEAGLTVLFGRGFPNPPGE